MPLPDSFFEMNLRSPLICANDECSCQESPGGGHFQTHKRSKGASVIEIAERLLRIGGKPDCDNCCTKFVRTGTACEYHVPTKASPDLQRNLWWLWFQKGSLDTFQLWEEDKQRFFPKTRKAYQMYKEVMEDHKSRVDAAVTEECVNRSPEVDSSPYV